MSLTPQVEFEPVVRRTLDLCWSAFGERLLSVYTGGSIWTGEALAGASDLDWWMFLREEPTAEDLRWCETTRGEIAEAYPIISGCGLQLYSRARLAQEEFWRFALRYNASLLQGADLVTQLEREGVPTPRPGPALAKARLPWVQSNFEAVAAGQVSGELFDAPSNPFLLSRKLARNYVVTDGAFLLMACHRFTSFQQTAVLAGLRSSFPQWEHLYSLTERLARDPVGAGLGPEEVVCALKPFVNFAVRFIAEA